MKIIKDNLVEVYKDGKNIKARANMLATSSMGSIAFQKGLGAIHSLSHPIGAIYNTHHGLTNAVFMPYVLLRNKEVIENKITDLSRYLNLSNPSFNSFLDWIINLRKSLSIPHTLKELIDDDSNFEKMSIMAFKDPSTGTNPIQLNESDFLQLYQNSFEGKL
tara:strand:- start:547 stop:1032 length:486 start_codon:yes stop_codon:yes gene_type:complete